jgi:hypothetical protein
MRRAGGGAMSSFVVKCRRRLSYAIDFVCLKMTTGVVAGGAGCRHSSS